MEKNDKKTKIGCGGAASSVTLDLSQAVRPGAPDMYNFCIWLLVVNRRNPKKLGLCKYVVTGWQARALV